MNIVKYMGFCVAASLACLNVQGASENTAPVLDEIASGQAAFAKACDSLRAQNLSTRDRLAINHAVKNVRQSIDTTFTEEELITAMGMVLDNFEEKLPKDLRETLDSSMFALAKRLSKFKITGFAYALDPNGAFFVDTQDPAFTVFFKNQNGEIKTMRLQADIESIGFKVQFSLNINFIFFVGADFNYIDAHEKINLGVGGEMSLSVIPAIIYFFVRSYELRRRLVSYLGASNFADLLFTYVPFKKIKGGMLLTSLCLGITSAGSLSVVTGGSLTPVE